MALDLLPQFPVLRNRFSKRAFGHEVAYETRLVEATVYACGLGRRYSFHIEHMQFPHRLDLGGLAISVVKLADTGPTYCWLRGHYRNGDVGALRGIYSLSSSRTIQFLLGVGRLCGRGPSRFTCTTLLLPAALSQSSNAN